MSVIAQVVGMLTLLLSPLSNDVTESNLRSAAFEALSASVQFAPTDCYPIVLETTNVMLQRLQACGNMPVWIAPDSLRNVQCSLRNVTILDQQPR
jgi:importin subunit beta-1